MFIDMFFGEVLLRIVITVDVYCCFCDWSLNSGFRTLEDHNDEFWA